MIYYFFSENIEEYLEHLKITFAKLRKYVLKCNKKVRVIKKRNFDKTFFKSITKKFMEDKKHKTHCLMILL